MPSFIMKKAAYCRFECGVLKPESRVFRLFSGGKSCTYCEVLPYDSDIQTFVLAHVFAAYFVQRYFNFKIIESQNVIVNQSVT